MSKKITKKNLRKVAGGDAQQTAIYGIRGGATGPTLGNARTPKIEGKILPVHIVTTPKRNATKKHSEGGHIALR